MKNAALLSLRNRELLPPGERNSETTLSEIQGSSRFTRIAEESDDRRRSVLVSTCLDTYSGVPDDETVARLRHRVDDVFDTRSVAVGSAIEIAFADAK